MPPSPRPSALGLSPIRYMWCAQSALPHITHHTQTVGRLKKVAPTPNATYLRRPTVHGDQASASLYETPHGLWRPSIGGGYGSFLRLPTVYGARTTRSAHTASCRVMLCARMMRGPSHPAPRPPYETPHGLWIHTFRAHSVVPSDAVCADGAWTEPSCGHRGRTFLRRPTVYGDQA